MITMKQDFDIEVNPASANILPDFLALETIGNQRLGSGIASDIICEELT